MWFIVVLFIVTCLFYYSSRRLRYFSTQGVRTLPPIPFLGNLTAVTLGRENFVDTIAAGYSSFKDQRYFGFYQYHVPTVIPRDPDLIRQIMVRDFSCFYDRGVHIPTECDPLFSKNVLMLKGPKWRDMRAAVTPAFSAARSRGMAPLMAECAKASVRFLRTNVGAEKEIDTDSVGSIYDGGAGKEIDIDSIATPYVNDVIASCAFGFAVDSLQDPSNCILRLGKTAVVQHTSQIMKLFGYANFPWLMKLLRVKIISSSDAEKFSQLFRSALEARREKKTLSRPDFIQTLVDIAQGKLKQEARGKTEENNNTEDCNNWTKKFTDEDLVAQAVLFYVAGFDTTANLINFFLYEMATNTPAQERLLREIDSASEEDGDVYQMVQGLEYLEMCCSEVLRLWPLVGSVDRRSAVKYDFGPVCEGSERRLIAEPGIHIWLPIYSIHRDPAYWPDPEQFRPERFDPARRGDIAPYTYMPFGNGPRHCIGSRFALLTAKVFLVGLLREFSVRPSSRTPRPQRLNPLGFVLRSEAGFHLVVEPRRREKNNISA